MLLQSHKSAGCLVFIALIVSLAAKSTRADNFTIIDQEGKAVAVEARLAGSGQEVHALELADGRLLIVPQSAVEKREIAEGPEPLDGNAVAAKLQKTFGEENIRTYVQKPFVIGLVLAGRRGEPPDETRIRGFLKKAERFFDGVQANFLKHIRRVRIQASAPIYPLVVLIFEADSGFDRYASAVTGNRGLSAQNMAGFYSPLTNYLTLRMSECDTFDTPLHEAIHQQVYNRGIFQRLAPIPTWFNEGIATAFEGDGERVRNGPMQVSERYAKLALRAQVVDWREVVRNDRAFRGDVFAGEAYGHAWGLHWLLANKYKVEYLKYMQLLSVKKPLEKEEPEKRLSDLEEIMQKDVGALQKEFYEVIARELKQRSSLDALALPLDAARGSG